MPVTVSPKFGTFDFDTHYVDTDRWEDEPEVESRVTPAARSDVARAADGFLRPRVVSLGGILGSDAWTTRDDLRTEMDAFLQAHRPGRRNLYRDSDRYLRDAQVQSVSIEDEGFLWVKWRARYEAADPYYHATSDDTDTWSGPSTGGTRTFANGGTGPALPRMSFTFTGSGTLDLDLFNDTLLPAAPTLGTSTTGGALAAGTYWVKVAWLLRSGETAPGTVASQVTTGSASTVTVTAPTAPEDAVGFYVYVGLGGGEPADSAKWRQSSVLTPIGRTFTFGTLVTSGVAATTPTVGNLRLNGAVTASDVLVVDSREQRVTLNNQLKMSYFTGWFPWLQAGNNTLRLTFSGATVAAVGSTWTKRWL